MKKLIGLLAALSLILVLAACGDDSEKTSGDGNKKLVVGATSVPHAEVLEKAKPILAKKGVDIEVKVFNDYNTPNIALNEKSIDANYFQTIPYMELQMSQKGYKFVNAGGIHIEPIGIYSKKYKSLDELPKGAEILLSNSTSDHARILGVFEANGLIKLKDGVDKLKAQISDIIDNPKALVFKADYNAELLPQIYNQGEGDAVVINSNFALGAGLNPMKDAIALEDKDSPYVNVITVNEGHENDKAIKTLVEVLHSKEIQDWIVDKYGGSVVPVSE